MTPGCLLVIICRFEYTRSHICLHCSSSQAHFTSCLSYFCLFAYQHWPPDFSLNLVTVSILAETIFRSFSELELWFFIINIFLNCPHISGNTLESWAFSSFLFGHNSFTSFSQSFGGRVSGGRARHLPIRKMIYPYQHFLCFTWR